MEKHCSTWSASDWKLPEKALSGIKDLIKDVPDFPKKGILFKDIMPVFQVPHAVTAVVDMMVSYIQNNYNNVDAIVGLDARGFLIGPCIAIKLNKPFVPIRKKGKLPGDCFSVSSTKEYGADVQEIQKDGLRSGQNVVVVDDLLATGYAESGIGTRGDGGCHCSMQSLSDRISGTEWEKETEIPLPFIYILSPDGSSINSEQFLYLLFSLPIPTWVIGSPQRGIY